MKTKPTEVTSEQIRAWVDAQCGDNSGDDIRSLAMHYASRAGYLVGSLSHALNNEDGLEAIRKQILKH